jgi:hypothetical protein
MEIRSFRRVFELERRIYRIDRLRLNPGGVPVRVLLYFLALVAACALASRLPLLGYPLSVAPWYLRNVALPATGTAALALLRVDGRPGHVAAAAIARYRMGPRCLIGGRPRARVRGRWSPHPIVLLADGAEAGPRRMRCLGPTVAVIAVEHRRRLAVRRFGPPRALASVGATGAPRRSRARRVIVLPQGGHLSLGPRAH